MEQYIIHALQTVFCGGIFYLLYKLVMDCKASYTFCRIYLVLSVVFSALIPFLKIRVFSGPIVEIPLSAALLPVYELPAGYLPTPGPASGSIYFLYIYLAVSLFFVAGIVAQIVRINGGRVNARRTVEGGVKIYESGHIKTPFTFLKQIFIPEGLQHQEKRQILTHELSHARHNHGIEILLVETVKALVWYNPFAWLVRKELEQVHEYQADQDVIDRGHDVNNYKTLLFRQLMGYSPDISSGLACSKTKKRFIMMEKSRPGRRTLLRATTTIPVLGGLLLLFSFTAREPVYKFSPLPQSDIAIERVENIEEEPRAHGITSTVSVNTHSGESPVVNITGAEIEDYVIIINGRSATREEFDNLDPSNIQNVSVISGKQADITGSVPSKGTIHVTTKEFIDDAFARMKEGTFNISDYGMDPEFFGQYAVDFSNLTPEQLQELRDKFAEFETGREDFLRNMEQYGARLEKQGLELMEKLRAAYGDDFPAEQFRDEFREQIAGLQQDREAMLAQMYEYRQQMEEGYFRDMIETARRQSLTVESFTNTVPDKVLIEVDGKQVTMDEFKKIEPPAIHSVSVLKDKKYLEEKGVPDVEAVVIVTTRSGGN